LLLDQVDDCRCLHGPPSSLRSARSDRATLAQWDLFPCPLAHCSVSRRLSVQQTFG
jgi:hypothetical protein